MQITFGKYIRKTGAWAFPVWILQQLDDAWMLEPRSPAESSLYIVNIRYVRVLQTALKSQPGRSLEWLAHYILHSIPGCRAKMNVRSQSTQYDVVGALEGKILISDLTWAAISSVSAKTGLSQQTCATLPQAG